MKLREWMEGDGRCYILLDAYNNPEPYQEAIYGDAILRRQDWVPEAEILVLADPTGGETRNGTPFAYEGPDRRWFLGWRLPR